MEKTRTGEKGRVEVLAVGELLVDLISTEPSSVLAEAERFQRFPGGSPANLTANLARLGRSAALVARVGNESLGRMLLDHLGEIGVHTEAIKTDPAAPTSIVLVTRTDRTADFIAWRTADIQIQAADIDNALLEEARIYHTTCFALSREPARSSILDGARRAVEHGCRLSIDLNYAPSLWGDAEEARKIVADYCRRGALVKMSRDDVARLFQVDDAGADDTLARLHDWGAELICLTLGGDGCMVSWAGGRCRETLPARPVDVVDATGAGDAFWAGFLSAWLDDRDPVSCARAGTALAMLKLKTLGPLPSRIDPNLLLS
ncbi:MAG: carbohydrate kinase [Acidobacteriota bacterium]|nr:carbohydrate kinase [Acidobacteriota bacterium]